MRLGRPVLFAMLVSCGPVAKPSPPGTVVIDWTESKTALDYGVSLGATVGTPVHEVKIVEFTPNAETRDKSLKPARIELTIDREDVAIVANASGARPGELGALPRHVTANVLESGGWQFKPAHCDEMLGPADIGERSKRVGFSVICSLTMMGGRYDMATVIVTIAGNGEHKAQGAFGSASIL